jgi:hypothetical protein
MKRRPFCPGNCFGRENCIELLLDRVLFGDEDLPSMILKYTLYFNFIDPSSIYPGTRKPNLLFSL